MRIVVDTNVFVSGVFFTGPPHRILKAWADRKLQIVVSKEILDEYDRVGRRLANQFPNVDLGPFFALLATAAEVVEAKPLPEQVCTDPDDDKFLACALAGRCRLIVRGDRALLKVSGYRRLIVVRPVSFVAEHLRGD